LPSTVTVPVELDWSPIMLVMALAVPPFWNRQHAGAGNADTDEVSFRTGHVRVDHCRIGIDRVDEHVSAAIGNAGRPVVQFEPVG
jgi:hypothetical protein